jgi:hypothetical protein
MSRAPLLSSLRPIHHKYRLVLTRSAFFFFWPCVSEIEKGDAVTAVNGIATGARYGLTLEQVKPLIVGNPGTTVRVKKKPYIPQGEKIRNLHVAISLSSSILCSCMHDVLYKA